MYIYTPVGLTQPSLPIFTFCVCERPFRFSEHTSVTQFSVTQCSPCGIPQLKSHSSYKLCTLLRTSSSYFAHSEPLPTAFLQCFCKFGFFFRVHIKVRLWSICLSLWLISVSRMAFHPCHQKWQDSLVC